MEPEKENFPKDALPLACGRAKRTMAFEPSL